MSGQDHDRKIRIHRLEAGQESQRVSVGQPIVEHRRIGRVGPHRLFRRRARIGLVHLETLGAQEVADSETDGGFVGRRRRQDHWLAPMGGSFVVGDGRLSLRFPKLIQRRVQLGWRVQVVLK